MWLHSHRAISNKSLDPRGVDWANLGGRAGGGGGGGGGGGAGGKLQFIFSGDPPPAVCESTHRAPL